MVIVSQGQNPASRAPSLADILSPLARSVKAGAEEKRQQQKQISQNTILQSVLNEIAENPNANFNDIAKAFAKGQQQGLQPQYQQQYLESAPKFLEAQRKAKEAGKTQDLSIPMRALETIEGLLEKPGIGKSGSWFNYGPEARKNRGIFESTQAALLPLFKSMFPRGMTEKEFKFIQEHYIPQSSDTIEAIKGKIQGLRQLMGQGEGGGIPGTPEVLGREQIEKPQMVNIRHKKTGKTVSVPRSEYRPHPDIELLEGMNQ